MKEPIEFILKFSFCFLDEFKTRRNCYLIELLSYGERVGTFKVTIIWLAPHSHILLTAFASSLIALTLSSFSLCLYMETSITVFISGYVYSVSFVELRITPVTERFPKMPPCLSCIV
ncbi:hypothetical protein T11_15382 [Trichinella zimbabwensis]|uniref:Uncharacterized protein n=1 Tax=Trichinella zimbabwensis TaxID=268475 RepID=A0A0V1H5C1_9BILA|nr:hypothetical protein T11_15382 [Trichinella zimbabwensis]